MPHNKTLLSNSFRPIRIAITCSRSAGRAHSALPQRETFRSARRVVVVQSKSRHPLRQLFTRNWPL